MPRNLKVSPSRSFAGFSWWELLKHNAKYLKEILKWGVGAWTSFVIFNQPWLEVPMTIVAKIILDSFEFWLRSVELE